MKLNLHPMRNLAIVATILIASADFAFAGAQTDILRDGFNNPPQDAKPQTWWHWMNGNITKEGITADLEAMKEIGLGSATIVNADCGVPRGDVPFMSDEWRSCLKHAVAEADRLGLKIAIENCAGWSSSGGPWNTAETGMKMITTSEVKCKGGTAFSAKLPQPETRLNYYRDIAVLAFPDIPLPKDEPGAKYEFKLVRASFVSKNGGIGGDVTAKVKEYLDKKSESIPATTAVLGDPIYGEVKQLVLDFTVNGEPKQLICPEGQSMVLPISASALKRALTNMDNDLKSTFANPRSTDNKTPIPVDKIIDITDKMTADGTLTWDAPEGDWIIMRIGYTPTARNNHPAPAEGTGLECDKMSKSALEHHWNGFMKIILEDLGERSGRVLDTSLIDSYEVGQQDWTAGFREEFQKRRGYDPLKYLITHSSRIVENNEVTHRFLWDMRKTISDLFNEYYFGYFNTLCEQNGLLSAIEPYSGPFESLSAGKGADVVMGEFWSGSTGHGSVRLASSLAHIYGKSIVAAESFTATDSQGKWQNIPSNLKALGDLTFSQGLNRYIFHRYAMQPWTDRFPGMTMGPWGFHFDRTTTWWKQGKEWISYISRCKYLLQQGIHIADVAYFVGEDVPSETRFSNVQDIDGFEYDAVNADVLLNGATVQNGRIVLASGASYAILVLPPAERTMTPELLAKIKNLVEQGATVHGLPPTHAPGLTDYPNCDVQVKQMTDVLWAGYDIKGTKKENAVGNGRVVWGKSLSEILAEKNMRQDFSYTKPSKNTKLVFNHRQIRDLQDPVDIFFVSNQNEQYETVDCTFRIDNMTPEFWHPDTGVIEPVSVWSQNPGRTKVRMTLDPVGSVFVIFRKSAENGVHVCDVQTDMQRNKVRAGELVINKAVYAALDGSAEMDVTSLIAAQERKGLISFMVNNTNIGKDPAKQVKKVLNVDYTIDGKQRSIKVPENTLLQLPLPNVTGNHPKWEVTTYDAKNKPAIRSFENANFRLWNSDGSQKIVKVKNVPQSQEVDGLWTVNFPPNWGAPESITLVNLVSWTDYANDGVKYFSGTADYKTTFVVDRKLIRRADELWLDLGDVRDFADVELNGVQYPTLWKQPFRINVTDSIRAGKNELTVRITNRWINRLIGDAKLPEDREWNPGSNLRSIPDWVKEGKPSPTGRFTFTTWYHWGANDTPLESGLLGPVTIQPAMVISK